MQQVEPDPREPRVQPELAQVELDVEVRIVYPHGVAEERDLVQSLALPLWNGAATRVRDECMSKRITTLPRIACRLDDSGSDAFVDGENGIVVGQKPSAGLAAGPNMTIRLIVGRG